MSISFKNTVVYRQQINECGEKGGIGSSIQCRQPYCESVAGGCVACWAKGDLYVEMTLSGWTGHDSGRPHGPN